MKKQVLLFTILLLPFASFCSKKNPLTPKKNAYRKIYYYADNVVKLKKDGEYSNGTQIDTYAYFKNKETKNKYKLGYYEFKDKKGGTEKSFYINKGKKRITYDKAFLISPEEKNLLLFHKHVKKNRLIHSTIPSITTKSNNDKYNNVVIVFEKKEYLKQPLSS